jgi:hypothetical protein
MRGLAGLSLFALTAAAPATGDQRLDGDQLLARAAACPGLVSYAVPVTFAVHLRKPFGIRTRVEGTAYFKAPAQAALMITRAGGLVGGFFRGAYSIDIAPQAWPQKYRVVAVAPSVVNGIPVELLQAEPRGASASLAQVEFALSRPALEPIAAAWHYRDGSSVRLTYTNAAVGTYTLPQAAQIAVDMPRYRLDANAQYGSYALNAPVPAGIFAAAK